MLDDLKKQYLDSLTAKIDSFKTLVREFREGDQEAEKKIRTLAHSLHGSGATFGFPEITDAAREVEHAEAADFIKNLTLLIKVMKEAGSKPAPPPPAVAPAEGQARILIIDDDPDSIGLLKDSISAVGGDYHYTVAESAARGMDLLLRQKFSLVVLDLILPDRDGREVLRDMKYEFRITTPVFVLSAITKDVVRIECMGLGAERYFVKPFTPEDLAGAIHTQLQKGGNRELRLVPLGQESGKGGGAKAAEETRQGLAGKLVLVAEDDPMQGKLVRERLQQEGLVVELVDNGQAALNALQKKTFSLLVLDVNMPLVDGFDVLKRVRAQPATEKLPVIMLTAMGSEKDIVHGYDLGANDYILKPINTVLLVARAKSLLK